MGLGYGRLKDDFLITFILSARPPYPFDRFLMN